MDPLNVFLFLVLGLGIPFAYAAFSRQKKHQETIALIEAGLMEAPKQKMPKTKNGKGALRWGIVTSFLGLALTIGLYPLGFAFNIGSTTYPLNFGPWMLIGLIPAFFGLSLIVVYFVTQDKPEEDQTIEPQEETEI